MTIHSHVDYKCEFCETHFVPIPQALHCPKCGRESTTVFADFVMNTRKSALFNLKKHNRAIPPAWLKRNIGDHYYLLAFRFLEYVCSEAPASRRRLLLRVFPGDLLDSLATSFLDTLDFEDQSYRRDSYKTYLSLLLLRERTS